MNSNNKIWGTLLKVALGLILVLSFLQVKMKFGWDPLDRCSLPPDSILIESITLSDSVMNIEANKTQNLLAQIEPANATNKNLKWSSSDTTVAIVDPTTGSVTATGKGGECIITAMATDDSGKSDTIKIKVKKEKSDSIIRVSTITFQNSKDEIILNPGSNFKIDAMPLPEKATNKILKWMSDKEGVATVNNGIVTGRKAGECTITASSTDGSNVVKSIKVRVQKIPDDDLDGKTIEEKVKYYLSYFSNSTNTTTSKKAKAKDMDSLFAPDALIIIKDGPVSQKEKKSRIGIWASSKMKIRYISHKVNTSGLIKELTVEEDL